MKIIINNSFNVSKLHILYNYNHLKCHENQDLRLKYIRFIAINFYS